MTPSRWPRAQELFHQARSLPEEERGALLDEHCDSEELRQVVERMLAHDHAAGFLDEPDAVLPNVATAAEPAENDHVGPYRVLRRIGDGGMGTVYLARRADGLFDRQVALKVIRLGLATDDVLARFQSEQDILAQLEHPNVARLYDAGATEVGRPYFSMEYVEGRPIDVYCQEEQATLEERLRLFEQICNAVAYAHRNLVLHRDLKPSNVLVTDDGRVKLLDFGLAKVLQSDGATREQTVTTATKRLLTPQYASPEQIRGRPLSTATDVYSLGVVLYQLLSGRRPYDVTGKPQADLEQIVLEEDPPLPSRAVRDTEQPPAAAPDDTPTAFVRRLEGDLDNIVMKALRKEPERRYDSIEQLAEDLRRYRNGLPVTASRPTWTYVARRFVRRHRTPLALTGTMIATLLVFATVVTVQAVELRQERDEARLQREKTQQIVSFLTNVLGAASPRSGEAPDVSIRQVLQEASERASTELSDEPEVRAAILHELGGVFSELGLREQADSLLRAALSLRIAVHARAHPDVIDTQLRLGNLYLEYGRLDAADSLLQLALTTHHRLPEPSVVQRAEILAATAYVQFRRGDASGAADTYEQVLALYASTFEPGHEQILVARQNLAAALQVAGRDKEAAVAYAELLAAWRAVGTEADYPRAIAHNNYGSLLRGLHRYDEATTQHRIALRLLRHHLGPEHPTTAVALNNLGLARMGAQDLETADSLLRQALALRQKILPPDHPRLAETYTSLGMLHKEREQHETAVPVLQEALRIYRQAHGDAHRLTAVAQLELGAAWNELDQPERALTVLEESYNTHRALLPPGHHQIRASRLELGRAYAQVGRLEQAEALLSPPAATTSDTTSYDDELRQTRQRYVGILTKAKNTSVLE